MSAAHTVWPRLARERGGGMKLDTPDGEFTIHFHVPESPLRQSLERARNALRTEQARPRLMQDQVVIAELKMGVANRGKEDLRHRLIATLHRGPCVERITTGVNDLGLPCRADSPAVAEITAPKNKPFRRATARATALAKCMVRMGLNKPERIALWQSYFEQVNVLTRVCVGVVTTCGAGHRHTTSALMAAVILMPRGAPGYFGDALQFCEFVTTGKPGDEIYRVCGQPIIEAKHRYLYGVVLPEGKRGRRQRPTEIAKGPFDLDDIPF